MSWPALWSPEVKPRPGFGCPVEAPEEWEAAGQAGLAAGSWQRGFLTAVPTVRRHLSGRCAPTRQPPATGAPFPLFWSECEGQLFLKNHHEPSFQ